MTPADLALLAALCISPECRSACVSPLEPAPEINITFALPSPCVYRVVAAKPVVEFAAAVKPRAKRKMASRCDGSKAECRMSNRVCVGGWPRADWYKRKDGSRGYRCRRTA